MTKRIHWIAVNGQISVTDATVPPTLEEMQEYVDGYIEVVAVLFNDGPQQMIINEEGALKQLRINLHATSVYHAAPIVQKGQIPNQVIYGNAILLDNMRLD